MTEVAGALTLANICLDVHIGPGVCVRYVDVGRFSLLSEVLFIIKTCKANCNVQFGWLLFIEYALTMPFSFQFSHIRHE